MNLNTLRKVTNALAVPVELLLPWHGAEVDLLLDAKHAALQEAVVAWLTGIAGWTVFPEFSYAVYAERGVIDILAWHPGMRALLIIELKSVITDLQALVASMDRRQRLARKIVADRGWEPASVSAWVIAIDSRTNRRRIAQHHSVLRAAFPDDGWAAKRWVKQPSSRLAALSLWPNVHPENARRGSATRVRVRTAATDGSPAATEGSPRGSRMNPFERRPSAASRRPSRPSDPA